MLVFNFNYPHIIEYKINQSIEQLNYVDCETIVSYILFLYVLFNLTSYLWLGRVINLARKIAMSGINYNLTIKLKYEYQAYQVVSKNEQKAIDSFSCGKQSFW